MKSRLFLLSLGLAIVSLSLSCIYPYYGWRDGPYGRDHGMGHGMGHWHGGR